MKKMLALIGLSISISANAELVSYDDYELDTGTNIVTGGGLQWLQWTETVGMSVDTALATVAATYAGGGWELASNSQMASLYSAFFPAQSWSMDETDDQIVNYGYSAGDVETTAFMELFGRNGHDEYCWDDVPTSTCQLPGGESNTRNNSHVWFGSDANSNGQINQAGLMDSYTYYNSLTGVQVSRGQLAFLHSENVSKQYSQHDVGVALVRSVVPRAISIDIKPSKKPLNLISLRKDKNLTVAVVGDATFDALQVDPATVTFGPNDATPKRAQSKDYNRDGFYDLILEFKLRETGITCGDESAILTGATYSGEPVQGSDEFLVEPCP